MNDRKCRHIYMCYDLYVYMCICVYVYMCMCICVYVYMCVHTCVCTHTYDVICITSVSKIEHLFGKHKDQKIFVWWSHLWLQFDIVLDTPKAILDTGQQILDTDFLILDTILDTNLDTLLDTATFFWIRCFFGYFWIRALSGDRQELSIQEKYSNFLV